MALSADLLVGLGTALIVALLVAILAAVDPSIRRKVSVIRKNGHIESVWVNKRNLVSHGGAWWYVVDGQRYAAPGPAYTFAYRPVRSFRFFQKNQTGTPPPAARARGAALLFRFSPGGSLGLKKTRGAAPLLRGGNPPQVVALRPDLFLQA